MVLQDVYNTYFLCQKSSEAMGDRVGRDGASLRGYELAGWISWGLKLQLLVFFEGSRGGLDAT